MSINPEAVLRSLLRLTPEALESSARESGAIKRERKIRDAMTLLLMLLAYVASDYSLKDTAALFGDGRLPRVRAASLHERLVKSEAWLESLLSYALTGDTAQVVPAGARWLRLVDASVVNGPGSKGTDWRLHVLADQSSGRILAVSVRDASVGESAALHPLDAYGMFTFDRGYSHAPNIHALVRSGGSFIVRVAAQSIMICDGEKHRLNLAQLADRVPAEGAYEMPVRIPLRPKGRTCAGWHLTKDVPFVRARLIGMRLGAKGVMWLLADIENTLPAGEICALYRYRWQIELLFKRLKSCAHIDALKSRKGPSARPWLLAKLLFAVLAQELAPPNGPEGKPSGKAHRHSPWSRFRTACDAIRYIVLTNCALELALSEERLRGLMNTPRVRRQQQPLAPLNVR